LFFPLRVSREYARRRGGDLIGLDATPSYLFHPAVPERVAATLPEARLLVILRDPVDRAYSHYQHARRRNVEHLSFPDAVAAEEPRLAGEAERLASDPRYRSTRYLHRSYISRGLYAEQLERWLGHFRRSQLHVVLAEEFFVRPADVYAETIAFLGLPAWEPAEFPYSSPHSYPELDKATRAGLAERFAAPNARLSRLLGRELPWGMPRQPGSTSPSTVASSL
jgi:Sulfotransferase domain